MPTFQYRAILLSALEVDNFCFNIGIQVVVMNTVNLNKIVMGLEGIIIVVGKTHCIKAYGVGLEGASPKLDNRGIWRDKQVFWECNDQFIVIWVRSIV
jgi:hypothetical protein